MTDELDGLRVHLYFDDAGKVSSFQVYVQMARELPARPKTLLARFGKAALGDDERLRGFAWSPCPHGERCSTPAAYKVHIIDSDAPDEMWSISVADASASR